MSTGRTLFDGAALGSTAIFGCGEGAGGGTADVFDVLTMKVVTVKLAGARTALLPLPQWQAGGEPAFPP